MKYYLIPLFCVLYFFSNSIARAQTNNSGGDAAAISTACQAASTFVGAFAAYRVLGITYSTASSAALHTTATAFGVAALSHPCDAAAEEILIYLENTRPIDYGSYYSIYCNDDPLACTDPLLNTISCGPFACPFSPTMCLTSNCLPSMVGMGIKPFSVRDLDAANQYTGASLALGSGGWASPASYFGRIHDFEP